MWRMPLASCMMAVASRLYSSSASGFSPGSHPTSGTIRSTKATRSGVKDRVRNMGAPEIFFAAEHLGLPAIWHHAPQDKLPLHSELTSLRRLLRPHANLRVES